MKMYKSHRRRQALRLTAVLITLSLAGASLGMCEHALRSVPALSGWVTE